MYKQGFSGLMIKGTPKGFRKRERNRLFFLGMLFLFVFAVMHGDEVGSDSTRVVFPKGKMNIPQSSSQEKTDRVSQEKLEHNQETPLGILGSLLGLDVNKLDYEGILDQSAAYVERQTLKNVHPTIARTTFVNQFPKRRRGGGAFQTEQTIALIENMFRWQELEWAYTEEPGEKPLRAVTKLVREQAKIDPSFDVERMNRIIETVETKGLFVPSSILFRRFVLPYRPMRIPADCVVMEMPVKPDFHDEEHEVTAIIDFLAPFAPVCRIDFDTVGTAEIILSKSTDGKNFGVVQKWSTQRWGGIRGPLILQPAIKTRFLEIRAIAPAENAVLRNVRVFAFKEAAKAFCPKTKIAPVLDGDFKEQAWPREPQVEGFIRDNEPKFAEAQTTVRLVHDGSTFYVAAYLREPRMSTRVAKQTVRDAPLLDEDVFLVRLVSPTGMSYDFVVNSLGTQMDRRGDDLEWDGNWRCVTRDYPLGWAVEMAIPFNVVPDTLFEGGTVQVNFVRNRYNVLLERSSWSFGDVFIENTQSTGLVTLE